MSSIIERLTEGVVNRDMRAEGHALLTKWEKTGLLEGLKDGRSRQSMARLLENQAKELLRESSTMAGGDVEGFAAVAFPIVRRVFAGLIANDLVSVQPMSLPAGLIFFLDFTISRDTGDGVDDMYSRLGYKWSGSFYGGNVVGSQITGGVDLDYAGVGLAGGPYNLNAGYSSPTGSGAADGLTLTPAAGPYGIFGTQESSGSVLNKAAGWDPDFVSGSTCIAVVTVLKSGLDQVNIDGPQAFNVSCSLGNGILKTGATTGTAGSAVATARLIRRHTEIVSGSGTPRLKLVFASTGSDGACPNLPKELSDFVVGALTASWNTVSWAQTDDLTSGGALGSIVGQTEWGLENQQNIPEIDIKVDSVAITAVTKKLKAKWTPELGQDLNAYHNLDAEVELTSILSEQIALEIDREILADLVTGATAATYYWSRSPGLFVNRETGAEIGASSAAPDFTGTVSEWYETLAETINDVSAQIHRKTLRGGANFVVCSPEVANLLEFTAGFRASVTADDETGSIGAVKVGSLSKKFDVIVDPYFLRNVLLVGRRGSSFLESGYVYAPYVPLQTTPTIFGPEDFVPRKGVMTRYAKKMVRPDLYGLVIVQGLLGQSGA
jgi:hypothetical protein